MQLSTSNLKLKTRLGFTLIELLVAVGIILILAAGSSTMIVKSKRKNDLNAATKQITALISEAQSRAVSQEEGMAWGVYFENGASPFYALFAGSYSTGSVRGVYRLPSDISFWTNSLAAGSNTNIMFKEISGEASSTLNIVIHVIGAPDSSSTIIVSEPGAVSY